MLFWHTFWLLSLHNQKWQTLQGPFCHCHYSTCPQLCDSTLVQATVPPLKHAGFSPLKQVLGDWTRCCHHWPCSSVSAGGEMPSRILACLHRPVVTQLVQPAYTYYPLVTVSVRLPKVQKYLLGWVRWELWHFSPSLYCRLLTEYPFLSHEVFP